MEVLTNTIVESFQEWNAPLISIFIGLFIVYWEVLKTNKKLDQIVNTTSQNGTAKPSDDFANTKMQDAYHSGFRQGYAEAVEDLSGDSTRKSDDESPKVS